MIEHDALSLFLDTVKEGGAATFADHTKLPGKVFLCQPGKEPVPMEVPPPPVNRTVGSVESFVLGVESIGAAETTVIVSRPIVADRAADALGHVRDSIRLPLGDTEAFEGIGRYRAPAELVQDLRYSFGVEDSVLFSKLRNLKFRSVDEATVTADKNRESLGISVEREVGSGDGLPEEIDISVQVFDEFEHRQAVLAGFKADHKNRTLALKLLSETKKSLVRNALEAAVEHLRAKLPESTVLLG